MKKGSRYDSLFQFYGYTYKVDWQLIKAQAQTESGKDIDPDAFNKRSTAKGGLQFMDKTFLEWWDGTPGIQPMPKDRLIDPRDIEDAILGASAYMGWLLKQLNNNVMHALQAYNWGIGNMKKYLRGEIKTMPPETIEYPIKVMKFLSSGDYARLAGEHAWSSHLYRIANDELMDEYKKDKIVRHLGEADFKKYDLHTLESVINILKSNA